MFNVGHILITRGREPWYIARIDIEVASVFDQDAPSTILTGPQ